MKEYIIGSIMLCAVISMIYVALRWFLWSLAGWEEAKKKERAIDIDKETEILMHIVKVEKQFWQEHEERKRAGEELKAKRDKDNRLRLHRCRCLHRQNIRVA